MKISKDSARHYVWGGVCDGWPLLESDSLSVIEERIPPGGGEVLHYHGRAQQLFYILAGVATFESDGVTEVVSSREAFHIRPGVPHCIRNMGTEELYFLVISEPRSRGDRVDV
jgi:mannose-6-phosphate isomerase-like protein (cupin superfamily)